MYIVMFSHKVCKFMKKIIDLTKINDNFAVRNVPGRKMKLPAVKMKVIS